MSKAIIVDADSFNKGLSPEISKAILRGRVKLVITREGKFHDELKRKHEKSKDKRIKATTRFNEYVKKGRFHYICSKLWEEMYNQLKNTECNGCPAPKCRCIESNDRHVIAVAIVSGATVLVTGDNALGNDFKRIKKIHRNYGGLPAHNLSGRRQRLRPSAKGVSAKEIHTILDCATVQYGGSGECKGIVHASSCKLDSLVRN